MTPNSNAITLKMKNFLDFFVSFLESTSNIKCFQKKMMVVANVFPKLQTGKNLVRGLLKSDVSKNPSSVNMWNRPKYLRYLRPLLSCFFITVREADWKSISLSDACNLRYICWQIYRLWKLCWLRLWEFATPNSNAIILKTQIFLEFFVPLLESTWNSKHLEKKDNGHR